MGGEAGHRSLELSQLRLQTRPARHPATKQDSAIDSNAQPIERTRRQLDLVQRAGAANAAEEDVAKYHTTNDEAGEPRGHTSNQPASLRRFGNAA
mgnify:CR=1 FL=1